MPNHVTSKWVLTGPRKTLDAIKDKHINANEDGDPALDFDTVVPMPAVLRLTQSGSKAEDGYYALIGQPYPKEYFLSDGNPLSIDWRRKQLVEKGYTADRDGLLKYLFEHDQEALVYGALAIAAVHDTSFPSWYEWSVKNWGTKWNAYSFEVLHDEGDTLVWRMQTAWAVPDPIIRALAAAYPDVEIRVLAHDEGWNFADRLAYRGVVELANERTQDEAEMKHIYEQVHGVKPDQD